MGNRHNLRATACAVGVGVPRIDGYDIMRTDGKSAGAQTRSAIGQSACAQDCGAVFKSDAASRACGCEAGGEGDALAQLQGVGAGSKCERTRCLSDRHSLRAAGCAVGVGVPRIDGGEIMRTDGERACRESRSAIGQSACAQDCGAIFKGYAASRGAGRKGGGEGDALAQLQGACTRGKSECAGRWRDRHSLHAAGGAACIGIAGIKGGDAMRSDGERAGAQTRSAIGQRACA